MQAQQQQMKRFQQIFKKQQFYSFLILPHKQGLIPTT